MSQQYQCNCMDLSYIVSDCFILHFSSVSGVVGENSSGSDFAGKRVG